MTTPNEPLQERLTALERRVAALELEGMKELPEPEVEELPEPEPTATEVEPPSPRPKRRFPPPPPRPRAVIQDRAMLSLPDVELFVGRSVLGRVGMAALILAAAYFVQLVHHRLTPQVKVAGLYAAAAAMLVLGALLHRRTARYAALWVGGGVALAYFAGAAARLLYQLVDAPTAVVLLLGAAGGGQACATWLRQQTLATVAIAGAAFAPILAGFSADTAAATLGYAALLHAWSALVENRFRWHWARGAGVGAAVLFTACWFAGHSLVDTQGFALAQVLVLTVVAPELTAVLHGRTLGLRRGIAVRVGLALAQSVFALALLSTPRWPLAAAAGASWFALASWVARRAPPTETLSAALAHLGGGFGALAVWCAFALRPANEPLAAAQGMVLCGTALAVVLVGLRGAVRSGDAGALAALAVAVGGAARWSQGPATSATLLIVALAGASLLVWRSRGPASATLALALGVTAVLRTLFLDLPPSSAALGVGFAAMAAWFALGATAARRRKDEVMLGAALAGTVLLALWWFPCALDRAPFSFGDTHRVLWNVRAAAGLAVIAALGWARRLCPMEPPAALLSTAALSMIYAIGLSEVMDACRNLPAHAAEWSRVAVSVYSMAFSLCLVWLGFWRRRFAPRAVGIAGLLLATAKVVLFDLATVDTPRRMAVTAALGVILLAGGYRYARRVESRA